MKKKLAFATLLISSASASAVDQSNFNRSRVSHNWNSAQISSGYDIKAGIGEFYRGVMTLQYDHVKNPYKLVDKDGELLSEVVGDFSRLRLGLGLHLNRTWSVGLSLPFDNVDSKPFKAGNQHPNILTDPLSQSYSGLGDIELSFKARLEALSLRWNWVFETLITLPTGDVDAFNTDGDFGLSLRMAFDRYLGRENQFATYGFLGARYSPSSRLEIDPLYLPFEAEKRFEFGVGLRNTISKSVSAFGEVGGFLSFPFESGQNPFELSLGMDYSFGRSKNWKVYAAYGLEGLAGDEFSNDERFYLGLKRKLIKLKPTQVERFKESKYPVYSSSYDILLDSVHSETSVVKEIVGKAHSVYFVTNSSKFSEEGKFGIIDLVSHILKHKKYIKTLMIEGFADSDGNSQKNMWLSNARANAVKNLLINYGVEPSILKTVYHGDRKAKREADVFGKLSNRRADVYIKELNVEYMSFPEAKPVVQMKAQKTNQSSNWSVSVIEKRLFPKPFLINKNLIDSFSILTKDNLTWGMVSERLYGNKKYRKVLKEINYNRQPSLGDVIYFPSFDKKRIKSRSFGFLKYE